MHMHLLLFFRRLYKLRLAFTNATAPLHAQAGQGLAHVSQSAVQERLRRDYDDFPDLKYVHLPLEDILGAGQYERKDGTGFDCKALLALDDDGTGFQNADVVDRTLSFIFGGPGEKRHVVI